MTFEEILPYLKDKKQCRRIRNKDYNHTLCICIKDGKIHVVQGEMHHTLFTQLQHHLDILNGDWEIVE